MRLNNVASGRPAYYDRNAVTVGAWDIVGATGPHGQTTRSTYTVPTARTCMIGFMGVTVARMSVASNPWEYHARVQTQLASFANVGTLLVRELSNTIFAYFRLYSASSVTLPAGGTVTDLDIDGSTGGTLQYDESWSGTEFDA